MFGYEGVIARLKELDELLATSLPYGSAVDMTIVGGSALIVGKLIGESRTTQDIDVLESDDAAIQYFDLFDMNTDVNTFIYSMPTGWAKRKRMIPEPWETLRVYIPSAEDLFIMKLISSRRSDFEDLAQLVTLGTVDLGRVELILDDPCEVAINLSGERFSELLNSWNQFKRQNGTDA